MPVNPTAIDVHVGGRIRVGRKARGLSQTQLGEAYGISFQQIQKYENGKNRASASALFAFAKILGVPVAFFFEGIDAGEIDHEAAIDLEQLCSERKLVREIARLNQNDRGTVRRMIEALADAASTKAAFAKRLAAMAEGERRAAA